MKPLPIKRPAYVDGDVAYIPLNHGFTAVIDAQDIHLVAGSSWNARVDGKTVYARKTVGHGKDKKTVLMHRVIMDATNGTCCDHIDMNGLNNRRSNLRLASVAQNKCNQRNQLNNTSGFKGVSWRKQACKWTAQIRKNGKLIHLGYFESAEDAHLAYAHAAPQIHGEFFRVG